MRVMVTSKGRDLESMVDERYGRAEYFIIYDTDSGDFEAIKNPFLADQGGVGVSTSKFTLEKKVDAVISGSFGPNALEVLRATDIQLYKAVSSTVRENISLLKEGKLDKF